MDAPSQKQPSVILSLIPILVLIGLLTLNVQIFGDDSSSGPNQIGLLIATLLCMGIGVFTLKIPYERLEKKMLETISASMGACLILLAVGSLISLWIFSGIVPTMIYYGLELISPKVFLPVTCIICGVVSLFTGSSWGTSGTIGLALMGIGQTLGVPAAMVAGAVISGAYFGDKMSPLSDTTNLAPAMSGSSLFPHIRHMMYSSGPAIILAVIGFFILGLFNPGTGEQADLLAIQNAIQENFNVTPFLLLVPCAVLLMVAKKVPAFPALIIGSLLAIVAIYIFQGNLINNFGGSFYEQVVRVSFNGFKLDTNDKLLDELVNNGGMESMLLTISLIIFAMAFGGMMEGTRMLATLSALILKMVRSTFSLIAATSASCIFLNITTSDQYMAIVGAAKMFKQAYKDHGLDPKNLSRAVEDSGTVTSVLVPWNTGGIYHAHILGVVTTAYLPFCFFNLLSPLVSLVLGYTGWTIYKLHAQENGTEE